MLFPTRAVTVSGRRSNVGGYTMTLITVVRVVLFSRSKRKGRFQLKRVGTR